MRLMLIFVSVVTGFINFNCKKYLDVKSDTNLAVPVTLHDLQALLDNYITISQRDNWALEVVSDNYYVTHLDLLNPAIPEDQVRLHKWKPDFVFPIYPNVWSNCYDRIYYANSVLKGLEKIERTEANRVIWDDVKGQALFIRGKAYLEAAFSWCLAYDESTADRDLGLPIRLDPDFNIPSIRSTVKETYEQIVSDISASISLLPMNSLHPMRPNIPAAQGLMARCYLSMRKYDLCGHFANLSLLNKGDLFDFNNLTDVELNSTGASTFANFSPIINPLREILVYTSSPIANVLSNIRGRIDSNLYASYAINDRRKKAFFRQLTGVPNVFVFKGSYTASQSPFTGVATDEVYLMRAECYARAGNKVAALSDLNKLLRTRYTINTFTDIDALDANDALQKILIERRKELVYRNLRWMDIKRLNKEGANIILKRIFSETGEIIELLPNDLRYALAIPEEVIVISGIPQNPR